MVTANITVTLGIQSVEDRILSTVHFALGYLMCLDTEPSLHGEDLILRYISIKIQYPLIINIYKTEWSFSLSDFVLRLRFSILSITILLWFCKLYHLQAILSSRDIMENLLWWNLMLHHCLKQKHSMKFYCFKIFSFNYCCQLSGLW